MMIQRKSKAEALDAQHIAFKDKWKSAWLFNYYKYGRNGSLRPLKEALNGIPLPPVEAVADKPVEAVADNMGWLSWSDLFKTILRATLLATGKHDSPI